VCSRDGVIGFDELFEFVRGRRHTLDRRSKRVRGMRLEPPPSISLEEIAWDVEALRTLLRAMLDSYEVTVVSVPTPARALTRTTSPC
jgi:hypothetical protein